MAVNTSKWDASDYLESEEDIAEYLNAVIEENDPTLLQEALGDIARARGMTSIARETGAGRESLYKSLSASGNPSFATITKVLAALGLKITITPIGKLGSTAS